MPAYKYKTKDGKQLWYCSFYYEDWTGKNIKKKKMGFSTRREALEYEASFKDGEKREADISFPSLIQNYLEDCSHRDKPTTMARKRNVCDTKLLPYFEKLKLSEIDPARVRKWQNELIGYRDEKGKPYAETYLRLIHSTFSAIMNYAVKYYHLSSNPCLVSGSIGKSKAGEMSIWTRSQFEQFIPFEKKSGYHAAFNTLFYSGMREGELLALTPADIPRDEALIHINKTYVVIDGEEMFLTPKTEKSIRDVTIHKQLHQELLSYIDSLMIGDDERIFYFQKDGLLSEFKKITKKAGLPPIRIHDLRHSHASMLIEMGIPIMEISERLGHENTQVTLRIYAHLYPGKARNVSSRIEDLFSQDSDSVDPNF